MSATCPNGHVSQTDDFCDTCGAKIDLHAPAAPAPAVDPPPAAATGQTCPNCESVSAPDSLFCEACGYDFTTGALPRGAAAPTGAAAAPGSGEAPAVPSAAGEAPAAAAAPGGSSTARPAPAPGVAPPAALEWVAEVWIDPEWYAVQEAEEPLPSPGLPTVVALSTRSVLVGRVSTSRNIHPDIDCTSDTGVSRRHAQLTTDGTRWFVEDLGSSNGTFIGAAGEPLPQEPLAVGSKRELEDDERIYVGAWTRIVVREATDEERAAATGGA